MLLIVLGLVAIALLSGLAVPFAADDPEKVPVTKGQLTQALGHNARVAMSKETGITIDLTVDGKVGTIGLRDPFTVDITVIALPNLERSGIGFGNFRWGGKTKVTLVGVPDDKGRLIRTMGEPTVGESAVTRLGTTIAEGTNDTIDAVGTAVSDSLSALTDNPAVDAVTSLWTLGDREAAAVIESDRKEPSLPIVLPEKEPLPEIDLAAIRKIAEEKIPAILAEFELRAAYARDKHEFAADGSRFDVLTSRYEFGNTLPMALMITCMVAFILAGIALIAKARGFSIF